MELQLALDFISVEKGREVVEKVKDLVDVVELGTPFVFTYPLGVIGEFKSALPGVKILADYKILDGGSLIAAMAFDAGADVATVSARTWDGTISEVVEEGKKRGRLVLVDLMGVPEAEIGKRAKEVEALGADYVCVHRAISLKSSSSPEGPLKIVRDAVTRAKVAVAGGITLETLEKVVPCGPDLVIVGSAIASAADPRAMTESMRNVMGGK